MENISTDTMLQIVVTVAAALALWLRLDSKIDALRKELKGDIQRVEDDVKALSTNVDGNRMELKGDIQQVNSSVHDLRKELKGDIQRVDSKVDALTTSVHDFRVESVERLTRLEERSERRSEDQPEALA